MKRYWKMFAVSIYCFLLGSVNVYGAVMCFMNSKGFGAWVNTFSAVLAISIGIAYIVSIFVDLL